MAQDNEQHFVVAAGDAARRLTDRPVLLRVSDPGGRLGRAPAIGLVRENRLPAEHRRALLMGQNGKGVFIGWMPAGLTAIRVEPDADTARREGGTPRFWLRRLSLPELFLRCMMHSPKTVLHALRLLLRGNGKGFDFRLFRLCNSLSAPAYRDWFAAWENEDATSPTPTEALVILSGTADAIRKQGDPGILAAPAAEVRALAARHPHRDILWLRLPPDMTPSPDAIARLARPFADNPELAAIYCDEDMVDRSGNHHSPLFRPGWNPPLAASGWLRIEAALFRLRFLPENADLETAGIDKLLQAAGQRGTVAHLPRVSMHRLTARPAAPRPPVPPAPATPGPVTIIIPTRDRAELLSACLDGLLHGTQHGGLDIVVIDNDSREAETLALFARHEAAGHIRRIAMPGPFNFARACNLGVEAARHEAVLLLNNDVEPLERSWLAHLCAELDGPSVGAAGALLLFPDGSVQHGGVTLAGDSVARHTFHFLRPEDGEDDGLLSQRRHVSAVTAACLLTRRSLWRQFGGMNERDLAVAFNDVDYCLKLREAGQAVVWTPHARLLHRESMSRGTDDTPEKQARFAREEQYMHRRWGDLLYNDPYHNPNLSLVGEDFTLEARPRDRAPRIVR